MISTKDGYVSADGTMLELLADLGAAAAAIRDELEGSEVDRDVANEAVIEAVRIAVTEDLEGVDLEDE